MSRNDGRPRSAVTLTLDPLPYVTYADHHRTDVRSAEWDIQSEGGVEYVRVFDPRPGFIQDEEAYSAPA